MDESQQRFKVTSEFDPSYGGGYNIKVEDLSTGKCETGWCYNLVDVDSRAKDIAKRMTATPEAMKVSFFDYVDEEQGETPGQADEVEAE